MSAAPRARLAEPLLQLLAVTAVGSVLLLHLWAGLLVLLAFVCAWPPRVPWGRPAVRTVLLAYVPFALGWTAFAAGYLRLMAALGLPVAPQPMLVELAAGGWAQPGLAVAALGIVVVAPLVEELLFRGYVFTGLAVLLRPWGVQLATAALFGLAHGPGHALPIGVLSLLFGYLRQHQGALLPSVLAHALHNGVTLTVVLTWPDLLDLLYGR
ncbi:MAG: CPBP family intramembrane metalloprotease [Planctomycetes bacterium]|nr:CPBP family intramembrane metalloprotease [Planctomycetota bacterium]